MGATPLGPKSGYRKCCLPSMRQANGILPSRLKSYNSALERMICGICHLEQMRTTPTTCIAALVLKPALATQNCRTFSHRRHAHLQGHGQFHLVEPIIGNTKKKVFALKTLKLHVTFKSLNVGSDICTVHVGDVVSLPTFLIPRWHQPAKAKHKLSVNWKGTKMFGWKLTRELLVNLLQKRIAREVMVDLSGQAVMRSYSRTACS